MKEKGGCKGGWEAGRAKNECGANFSGRVKGAQLHRSAAVLRSERIRTEWQAQQRQHKHLAEQAATDNGVDGDCAAAGVSERALAARLRRGIVDLERV